MYNKLRQLCLGEHMRLDYPGWPFPLLFHGHEITRDIAFLDPLIEYRLLRLGRNWVPDAGSVKYRFLNDWFHYEFFFTGMSPVTRSAQTTMLLPRLFRLRRELLNNAGNPKLDIYLKRELGACNPAALVASFVVELSRVIEVCSANRLVVWGHKVDEDAEVEQRLFVDNVLSKIPVDLMFQLPHLNDAMRLTEWRRLEEQKLMAQAELRYRKRRETSAPFQQTAAPNGGSAASRASSETEEEPPSVS